MTHPRFDFYEQVRISTADVGKAHLVRRCGVVLGRTETEESDDWYYAVEVDQGAGVWCFYEEELEATGRRFMREDFYDGSPLRVTVDEQGRGNVDQIGGGS